MSSCYYSVEVKEHLTLMPCCIGKLEMAVHSHLCRHVLQYVKALGGTLVAYSQPVIVQQKGLILDDSPHFHVDVKYKAFVFKPEIGTVLKGIVNNIGVDHIGCLVDDYFNASLNVYDDCAKNYVLQEGMAVGDELLFTVSGIGTIGGILSLQGKYLKTGSGASKDV